MFCRGAIRRALSSEGQATVEAAFSTLALFGMILLLIQPAIWLYTRAVMANAAGETARVLVTMPDGAGLDHRVKEFAQRRLQAVPPVSYFRIGGVDDWDVQWSPKGNTNDAQYVEVTISIKQEPMPLIGLLGKLTMKTDADGNNILTVKAKVPSNVEAYSDLDQAGSNWAWE